MKSGFVPLTNPVVGIRIRWISNIYASWIRIRKNMRINGSSGKVINQKQKKILKNPNLKVKKKLCYQNVLILNGLSNFSIKKRKKKSNSLKILHLLNKSVNLKKNVRDLDPDPHSNLDSEHYYKS